MRKSLFFLGLVLLLAACSTSPRPDDYATVTVDSSLLGIAEVSADSVSVQALVPGLAFSAVDRTFSDGDGIRIQ